MFKHLFDATRQAEQAGTYGAAVTGNIAPQTDAGIPLDDIGLQDDAAAGPVLNGQGKSLLPSVEAEAEAPEPAGPADLGPAPAGSGPIGSSAGGIDPSEMEDPAADAGPAIRPAEVETATGGPQTNATFQAPTEAVAAGGTPIAEPVGGGGGGSGYADELGWGDQAWGDGGGFEAILRGALSDAFLPEGFDGAVNLNVFVENLDIDLYNVIENTLVQNTSVVFDAGEGGVIEVGGDVSALGVQTADADSLMAFVS